MGALARVVLLGGLLFLNLGYVSEAVAFLGRLLRRYDFGLGIGEADECAFGLIPLGSASCRVLSLDEGMSDLNKLLDFG